MRLLLALRYGKPNPSNQLIESIASSFSILTMWRAHKFAALNHLLLALIKAKQIK